MEQNNLLTEFEQPHNEPASTGQRFANYLIDIIVYYILVIILTIPTGLMTSMAYGGGSIGLYYLVALGTFFGYYILLEGGKGRTIGKMVTKTRVITTNGEPLTYSKVFLRTLCRIVPFEFISAFIGPQMWHDKWTDTMVVKDK
ncbi:MAG TPA: RDD family protein [Ferruginibacter sp.]|nr:RDD family protein [Ferruginibacter sp.]HMP20362.1 RDD family protein [Ferruginibacter sp.]